MKRSTLIKYTFIILIAICITSCKKKKSEEATNTPNSTPTTAQGKVYLNFTNVADNAIIQISADEPYTASTPKYINAFGDTFSVISFKYYISNIKLKRSDGSYYIENESYHLLDASDSSTCKFNLTNVPFDNYISVEFLLGVDSARNAGGAQTGQLDPSLGMYWAWNSGYIIMKFFGYSSSATANSSHNITYEIGGINNAKKIVLPLATNLVVNNSHLSMLYLKTNVLECFKNPNTISFAFLQEAMTPKDAQAIADNYNDIFTITAIK